jgi:hypothetical protein
MGFELTFMASLFLALRSSMTRHQIGGVKDIIFWELVLVLVAAQSTVAA